MNDGKRPQQVPSNADGNSRETHDDESALHSDWGSDESIHESLGDGRPRDAIDEHQGDPRGQDVPDRSLLNESGARSPDSLRGTLLNESGARGPDSLRVIICRTKICVRIVRTLFGFEFGYIAQMNSGTPKILLCS